VNDKLTTAAARTGRWAGAFILIVLIGLGAWTWLTLSWSYSEGERAGVLQKFSKKGWLCKTYEGEIAQYVVSGVSPQIWYFTVRDPALAEELFKVVGHSVQLRYTEHRGIPSSCFGDTPYFGISFTTLPSTAR
jgi:hypothetical protein